MEVTVNSVFKGRLLGKGKGGETREEGRRGGKEGRRGVEGGEGEEKRKGGEGEEGKGGKERDDGESSHKNIKFTRKLKYFYLTKKKQLH